MLFIILKVEMHRDLPLKRYLGKCIRVPRWGAMIKIPILTGGDKMAKFLLLWELDRARIPVDPKERLAGRTMLLNMVKDDIESGKLTDWGAFSGELAGYAIMEGTDQDVVIGTGKYDPYIKFKTHSVLSVNQALESVKALSQS